MLPRLLKLQLGASTEFDIGIFDTNGTASFLMPDYFPFDFWIATRIFVPSVALIAISFPISAA